MQVRVSVHAQAPCACTYCTAGSHTTATTSILLYIKNDCLFQFWVTGDTYIHMAYHLFHVLSAGQEGKAEQRSLCLAYRTWLLSTAGN